MTIGDVANRTGFRTSAIRYYEAIGLIDAAGRNHAGQRRYGFATVRRLRLIWIAREAGISLTEIRELFAPANGPVSAHGKRVILEKLAKVDRKRERLLRLTKRLQECEAEADLMRRKPS
jgi:DNA-binding transcriptional MerR regulator